MRTTALIGALLTTLAAGCGGAGGGTADPADPTTTDPTTGTADTSDRKTADATGDGQHEEPVHEAKPDDTVMTATGSVDVRGVWKGHEEGQAQPEWVFSITDTHMIVTAGTMEVYEGTYTVNAEASPIQIIAVITKSNMKQYVGKATKVIVELSGDSMSLAANEPGVDSFPADFTATGRARVFELTRVP